MRNLCAGPVAVDGTTGNPIRINAGVSTTLECAGTKTDCAGNTWLAETFGYNVSGSVRSCNLSGASTSNPELCVITGITTLFGCDNETTEDIFQCEHYRAPGDSILNYTFNVPNGRYIANLFFANSRSGTVNAGDVVFDIYAEGALKYGAFDQVVAASGSGKAVLRAVDVTVTDGNGLNIELRPGSAGGTTIKAIEVLKAGCTSSAQCNDNKVCTTDTCVSGSCQYTNNTVSCNDGLACTTSDTCGGGVCTGTSTCPAGQSCNAQSGVCDASSVSFNKSTLVGETLNNPTSLDFGPDGKLYVAQQSGTITQYTIQKTGPNSYVVTNTQNIQQIKNIPNHNDDGTLAPTETTRLVTGIVVAGTAANPVIYAVSTDPRIGGGSVFDDKNIDTNSGILSRLTWNGSAWIKLDLVRGLPRSEENHSGNGVFLDAATNTLYITYGGHTNMGAPGNNFVFLPEYALSAAILSVNLTTIGNSTYDLPTLNDEDRAGDPDANDPFGGNNGKNQAKLVAGGPVQVYASGFRNPYDVLVNSAGRMYTIDNGPNNQWGGPPINEGPTGNCTNAINENGTATHQDGLHFVTGAGFYGGHPNPTRANMANTFNASNPQSPVSVNHAIECDYKQPGTGDGSLAIFSTSTNGLTEYTTNQFSGQLQGELLAASHNNSIYRIRLTAAGTAVTSAPSILFSTVGDTPLDVIALSASDPFPGTIWVADHGSDDIYVFEPNETLTCTGADNPGLDEDGDQYDNADEIDNGTNPCSSADIPADYDHDFNSDINDSDDDNDTLNDTVDKFALDPDNGMTTDIPIGFDWENDDPLPDIPGILGLGFTGLMTNGTANYHSLYDITKMTAGGAAGVSTIDQVADGDALNGNNNQQYGFQFGVDSAGSAANIFTVHTRIVGPFLSVTPADFQSMGFFIGTGDQDNYFKLVLSANGGSGGVTTLLETGGVSQAGSTDPLAMPGPDDVDLYLTVNKSAGTVQSAYSITDVGVTSPISNLGSPVAIPQSWLNTSGTALAVGIISTSRGAAPVFPATWDFVEVFVGAPNCSGNAECDDGNPCTADVCGGGVCTNNAVADGTSCNDGVACTGNDECTAGVCGGDDTCPLFQSCNLATGNCGVVSGDPDNDGLTGAGDPCPNEPRNLCFGPVAVETATSKALRVHANNATNQAVECRGTKVDCNGDTWLAGFGQNTTGGNNICNLGGGGEGCVISGLPALFGCEDEATSDLFQCYRSDPSTAPELLYSYAVPNGDYIVNLFFANPYTGTATGGSRVFDISIEGTLAYDNFDIIPAAGGSGIAVVRSKVTTVSDGNGLQIEFGHVVENPALAAIEVLAAGSPPPPACTTNADCVDTNVCNGAETCNPGVGCQAGTPLSCNDGNACNGTETCNTSSGCQAGTPPTCSDGNFCNGTETCVAPTGCQSGSPPNCSDADPCTTDSCSANQCQHTGSCGGGSVQLDASSTRSACGGTAADTLTIPSVPVGSQADRILIVTVGAEDENSDCDLALASATATYGGISMSKAVTKVSDTTTWRVCNGIFYLLNPPTGTANVVVTFPSANTGGTSAAIDNRHAGAYVLFGAAQQAPEAIATAGGDNATTNTLDQPATAINVLSSGAVVVDVTTRGNVGTFATTQAGQVEQWDQSCTSSSSAGSIKPVASAGQTSLGWTHTGNNSTNRHAHALAAFAPSGGGGGTTTTTTTINTTTTTLPPNDAEAFVTITPNGGINASSYNANSFNVRNDSGSGQSITQIKLDLRGSIYQDLVYDPAGIAGDTATKCLEVDTGEAATGVTTPHIVPQGPPVPDACTVPFSSLHDDGYDVITVNFNDFDPGETFGFAVDVDPTMIRGTTGQGGDSAGSTSGVEMVGATWTITFDDGSVYTGQPFRIAGTDGGSQNIINAFPIAAPSIQALGVSAPATVTSGSQTIRVTGPAGAVVRLLRVVGAVAFNGGAGFDVDPFEASMATLVAETTGTIGAGGTVDIPVTLSRTSAIDDLNYIAAVVVAGDASGQTSAISNVIRLEYTPSGGGGTVQIDSASITSACGNTAADTITIPNVPVGSQANRVLVVGVGAGEAGADVADCNLALASATATYGGVAMTKSANKYSNSSTARACNGLFYLLNPPTGTANVVVNYPATTGTPIDYRQAGAFVLFGAAQQGPEVTTTAGAAAQTNPVETAITPLSIGSLVVDIFTQGKPGAFTATRTAEGQTERWEQSCGTSSTVGAASVSSTKPVTGAGQTVLGWSRTNANRYSHSLAVFTAAP